MGWFPAQSSVPAWNLHFTAGARGGLAHPQEQRARPRRPPTFILAQVPATGTVGVVEAIVEGQAGDEGQQEQQDQEQQVHCVVHGGSTSVSWARLWPSKQERREKHTN